MWPSILVFEVNMTLTVPTPQARLPGLKEAAIDILRGSLDTLISMLTMYHSDRGEC